MVMDMTITADSLLPSQKLDCDGGYDVAMKGLSVVVVGSRWQTRGGVNSPF